MLQTSRWFMNGALKHCSYCGEGFTEKAYRGENGKYYCSPLCLDTDDVSETVEVRSRRLQ